MRRTNGIEDRSNDQGDKDVKDMVIEDPQMSIESS